MRRLAALVLCLAAAPATAQTPAPADTLARIAPVPAEAPGDASAATHPRKNTRRAVLLSSLGTAAMVVPVANLVAIPVGPSLGHFYAGNARQAWTGIAIRSAALTVGVAAAAATLLDGLSGPVSDSSGRTEAALIGSAVVILASSAYDIATAGAAAQAYNRRHASALGAAVVPVVGPDGQRGVRLAVRL